MSDHAVLAQPIRTVDRGTTPVNQDRHDVLVKLLRLEPATFDNLVLITGWGKEATQTVLLQLMAAGILKCTNRDHGRWYSLRDEQARPAPAVAAAALDVDGGNPARCVGCACTDMRACPDRCWWLAVDRSAGTGVCSNCSRFLAGYREGSSA